MSPGPRYRSCAGFTMLELLIALTILVTAIAIIWQTFDATLRAWKKGGELLEDLHQGDFVMDQVVMSLRSATFFASVPGAYGFQMEGSGGGSSAKDEVSWTTASTGLIPPTSPLAKGVYRLKLSVENNDDGDSSLTVRAYPHLAEDAEDDADPWYIAAGVQGMDCRVYNFEEETWDEEWEDTNTIPVLVELTLFFDPLEKYGDPVEMTRLVEVPVAHAITSGVFGAIGDIPGRSEEPEPGEGTPEGVQVRSPGNQPGTQQPAVQQP